MSTPHRPRPGGVYWTEGYETYKSGEKIPATRNSQRFREGWWAAHDARERFGDYESFLQAPEELVRKPGRQPQVFECGTEQRYQQHAYTGDTAGGGRKVNCDACLEAHAKHERARLRDRAIRKLSEAS